MPYPHPERLMRKIFWLRVRNAVLTAAVIFMATERVNVEINIDTKKTI